MLFLIIAGLLVFLPQIYVKSTFKKYLKKRTLSGITGSQTALAILKSQGVDYIRVESVQGELTDHFDPQSNVIRLSEDVYSGNSISAVSVAAHEVGHAIQHDKNYVFIKFRTALFPVANLGQQLGPILIMVSLGLRAFMHSFSDFTDIVALLGIAFYAGSVFFHIVTLPVELNASHRAVKILSTQGFLEKSEIPAAKKVLTAAALTYIATALYSLIELLYWVYVLFNRERN